MKIKVIVLAILFTVCFMPEGTVSEAVVANRLISVNKNSWTIHGTYTKSFTAQSFPVKNVSMPGLYNTCTGHVRAEFTGGWTQVTVDKDMNRGSDYSLLANTTINTGVRVSFRLKGKSSWTSTWDDFRLHFTF